MKELAKQRTKQLQEEEEERTRKQKAKALAKLDELNKRSQAGDGSTQKEYIINSAIQNKLAELQPSESTTEAGKFTAVCSAAVNCSAMCQINDPSISRVEKSPILPDEATVETLKNSGKEPILNHNQAVALHQDINNADAANALHALNNVSSKQKRMSYKQKQNLPLEKTSSEKVVSATPMNVKVENEAKVDASLSSGGVTNEVGSASGSDLPVNVASVVESSANMKKKNMRNSRNKQKHDESSNQAVLPSPIPKETNLFKSSVESDKSKASDFELDQGVLQPAAPLSKDPNQFPEQHRYSANEESHGRTNSQWKSQHSRRLPRNMQANRPADKSHGTDAVMWAPVKPQNKSEIMDESVEKSKTEAVNPVKNEQQVHNLKNKRAEMERYIPKPVAKEMAQQGNILQVASSSSHAPTDDSIGRVDSGSQGPQIIQHSNLVVGKMGIESKNRDGRHTKQGKAHGSWRLRNLTESTNVDDELDHDSHSEPNVQRPTEHHHDHKSEVSSFVKGQTKHFNEFIDMDGSNNSNCNDSAALTSAPVIKDHAATSRGRRAPFRGHKGPGGNREVDNKRNSWEAERVEIRISSSEHGQPDVGMASKENRGVGERLMSQWQPKSQASNNHRGNISSDQNVSSVVVGGNKKDPSHDGESLPVSRGKSSNAQVSQPVHDQEVPEKSKSAEAPYYGNQEGKKERRNAPPKRHHHSPNLASGTTSVEQALTSADLLHDQRPSSGSGKNVNQNRFRRGHESHGDLKPPTQDNRHYNQQPINRERQGPSMHHEYHTLGPYDDCKSDNFERPKIGNHGERRFRERGPTHSRRGGGNSYGRQGGFESYD
ncbi:unnamed protein product [Sphenostylis stenocarpa]|uniref:Uncharacterized protein n=1 Tax=Sphenostylis stenocarpa TaxID=92480 RepID=A0AA86VH76_9FABA|nr:unnamed protein product [Sphenostylis stenocarpa]